MLSNDYFYFGSIRKYIALFGSLFNNVIINRTDGVGDITQIINVPVSYAQKEKMMVRMKMDPGINRQAAIVLPRMSFFFDGLSYDAGRKRGSINKLIYPLDANHVKVQYEEVPYKFHFSLYVYVKNAEDGTKIIEQIIPFFKPEFTVRAYMIPNHEAFDVSVNLMSVSHEDTDTLSLSDNSTLIWTLRFTINGSLFGPIVTSPLIKNVNSAIYVGTWASSNTANLEAFGMSNVVINTVSAGDASLLGYYSFTPGLTANGLPTSNAAISVAANTITATQDWGVILNIGGDL